MAEPAFHHIHCSSRYDSSEHLLEADLDDWMQRCSILTLTEMRRDYRAAKLHEAGWAHYNSEASRDGSDNCAIAWNSELWGRKQSWVRALHQREGSDTGGGAPVIYSISVLLRRRETNRSLLVTTTHMPAHVEGDRAHWAHNGAWKTRRRTYDQSMRTWSRHVADIERKKRPDAVLIASDFNLNLKEDWVRHYLHDHWGTRYKHAWTRFPTSGGSFHGGPMAPLGAPGVAKGDKIIDGTMYHGLKVTEHPNLMHDIRSSDHRPYIEGFRFKAPGERDDDDEASGDRYDGPAWWGFGDYSTDELYDLVTAEGEAGGEVL